MYGGRDKHLAPAPGAQIFDLLLLTRHLVFMDVWQIQGERFSGKRRGISGKLNGEILRNFLKYK